MCLSKNVVIETTYSPLFHEVLLILTEHLQEIPLLLISTSKTRILKNLTNILFVLTMPSERADNRAKLIGTTIMHTFANWQHKVQNKICTVQHD